MPWKRFPLLPACILAALAFAACSTGLDPQQRADNFLEMYDSIGQKLYAVTSEAYWKAATDVSETHTGERIGAEQAQAAFTGNRYVIEQSRALLEQHTQLEEITTRQLEQILLSAAEYPGTIPDVVAARVAQEAKQSAILDGFEFCADQRGERCVKTVTPNEIDNILCRVAQRSRAPQDLGGFQANRPGAETRPHRAAPPAQRACGGDGAQLVLRATGRRLPHDGRRDDGDDGRLQPRLEAALRAGAWLGETQACRTL
jgi:hypothetical protein